MRVSIIVPVLNEAPTMAGFLRSLRHVAPTAEIIVVDGQSADGSAEIAREEADQCVASSPGRARQMNAGAGHAGGDVLWFVHADSTVAPGSIEAITKALTDDRAVGGCSGCASLPRDGSIAFGISSEISWSISLGSLWETGVCSAGGRSSSLGAFRNARLEDAGFYRRLKHHGRVMQLHAGLSGRVRGDTKRWVPSPPCFSMRSS